MGSGSTIPALIAAASAIAVAVITVFGARRKPPAVPAGHEDDPVTLALLDRIQTLIQERDLAQEQCEQWRARYEDLLRRRR